MLPVRSLWITFKAPWKIKNEMSGEPMMRIILMPKLNRPLSRHFEGATDFASL